MAWSTLTQCVWIVIAMIMVGSCSVALKCEDRCDGCSTPSIVCYTYSGSNPGLPEIVAVLPPYTRAFSFVALRDTYIAVHLGDSNFDHLTELRILNITCKNTPAELFLGSSQQNVFASLAKLQVLKIQVEWYYDEPSEDLFRPLVHLQELDLSQTVALNITNIRRALYGLSNSTLERIKLSHIRTSEVSDTYSIFNLTWFLEPLQNCPIRHLELANNSFKEIYPGINRYTPLLEYIDVSHNLLAAPLYGLPLLSPAFFQETLLHKGLQEIDYSYQGPYTEEQTHGQFDSNHRFPDLQRFTNRRRNLSTSTLQQIVASLISDDVSEYSSECAEYLAVKPCQIFSPNCSDTLDYLRHNHRKFCELLYALVDNPVENFYRGIPCSALPSVDDMFQENCESCFVIPTTGSTKHLKLTKGNNCGKMFNHIYNRKHKSACFHQSNQLEYLDLSGNVDLVHMFTTYFNYQHSNITGLIHIKVLNVSNTGITSVFDNMLLSFLNLQVMDMSRNKITFDKERSVTLRSNRDIQFLSFANNQLTFAPQNLFSNLVSLQELDLSHNQIHNFDLNISELYSLETLNLESNMISEIPEATRIQLIQLAERIAPRVVTVNLFNNQLTCLCSSIPSLSFMSQAKPTNLVFKNYDKYFCCNRADDRVHIYNMNLHSLWFDCLGSGGHLGIGFACASVLIAIILLLVVIIYRKRWWFRYQYFLAHRVWANYNKIATFDTPFEYDLFVSYNHLDNQWVDEVLQPKLEDELGLRLCLHHRDFRLGEVITEQIIESVQSSKKTLFILSKSFLASTWCHFEIRMAQSRLFTTGKDVILLALLEPLPDRMVSKTMKGLMETRTYVEWTESDTYGQKLFWEKLYQSVQAPISQPFDLEEQAPPPGIRTEDSSDPSLEAAVRETEPLLASSRSELSKSWHQTVS